MEGFQPRPFGCEVGSQFHHEPRFPRPPYDPGRSDFPSPVLTLACPAAACPPPRELKRWRVYAPLGGGLHATLVPSLRVRSIPAQCPGPPSAQGPFARSGRYPSRRDLVGHISRCYPAFIAHTDPCVRPNPSRRLRSMPWSASLCRLSSVPAGRWPFPTLSPQSLYGCLDPYPAASLRCYDPLLSGPRQLPLAVSTVSRFVPV